MTYVDLKTSLRRIGLVLFHIISFIVLDFQSFSREKLLADPHVALMIMQATATGRLPWRAVLRIYPVYFCSNQEYVSAVPVFDWRILFTSVLNQQLVCSALERARKNLYGRPEW